MSKDIIKMIHYRPEIDGLRAVAVLGVLLSHAEFRFVPGGYLGVDVFFVISGFLITQIIIRESTEKKFNVWDFYSRRIRRLAPALYVVLVATLIAAWFVVLPDEFIAISKSAVSVVLFLSNMFFWVAEADYFSTSSLYNPLLHMWSLSVEEQFYFLFSIFILVFSNMLSRKRSVITLAAFLLMSLVVAEWGARNYPTASYYLIFTRAWELLLGCLGAIYFSKNIQPRTWMVAYFPLVGVGLILLSFFIINEHAKIPGFLALIPCIGSLLVLLYGQNSKNIAVVLGNKPLVIVGLISYSIYLWHQPVFAYARILSVENLNTVNYLLLILLIILLAALTWLLVEQPVRRSKRNANSKTFRQFVSVSLLIIVGCVATNSIGGNESRLPEATLSTIDSLNEELKSRSKNTLYDRCHFRPDRTNIGLENFIEQWSCLGEGVMAKIVVVGDSHAADIAHSLRENGMAVGQLTGAGCSLEPVFMAKHCQEIFSDFKRNYLDKGLIQGLILANRYNEYEMSSSAVINTNDFWKPELKKIIFSSKPEFPNFKNQLVRNQLNKTDNYHVDLSRAMRSFDIYSSFASSSQLVIDTGEIFCRLSADQNCKPKFNEDYLISDDSHFSKKGAILFGNTIKELVTAYFKN